MQSATRYLCALLLLLGLVPACGVTQSSNEPKGKPVATAGGETIYEGELLSRVQGDLLKLRNEEYQLKHRALQNLILRKLLDAEAKKRSFTVDQLLQKMEDQVPEPTDAEVRAQYEQQKDARKFDDVKEQYRNSLKQAKARLARQEYFQKLWEGAGVNILLEPPRVEVAFDPARVRGNPNAPVRIIEFSDFQCPFCRRVQPTLLEVLAKYSGQVSLAYRDFPLRELHAQAQIAAEASRCAGEQGKFWEFHDRLYAQPSAFDRLTLGEHAQTLGLDVQQFNTCVESGKYRAAVEEDLQAGMQAGVNGTPGFFINGVFLDGAQPASEFERIIDAELDALQKKGASR